MLALHHNQHFKGFYNWAIKLTSARKGGWETKEKHDLSLGTVPPSSDPLATTETLVQIKPSRSCSTKAHRHMQHIQTRYKRHYESFAQLNAKTTISQRILAGALIQAVGGLSPLIISRDKLSRTHHICLERTELALFTFDLWYIYCIFLA